MVVSVAVGAFVGDCLLCLVSFETVVGVVVVSADPASRRVLALAPAVSVGLAVVTTQRFRGVGTYVESPPHADLQLSWKRTFVVYNHLPGGVAIELASGGGDDLVQVFYEAGG